MKGLTNAGNTCYLNAALQCLLHAPGLTNYVLTDWFDKDLSKRRPNAWGVASRYAKLVRDYWMAAQPGVLDSTPTWEATCKAHKAFANGQPHDAHEALVVLLKSLHDALTRTPRIEPSLAYADVVKPAWDEYVAKEGYSILTELFVAQTESTVAGANGYESTTYEHSMVTSLDITDSSTVSQALSKSFDPTDVEYRFPDGSVGTARLTRRLVYAPILLVLHLKRFCADGSKIDKFVNYSTTLELMHHTYDLFGVIFHDGGHYVAACEAAGTWRLLDDAAVSEDMDLNSVVHKNAYVLLYKKKV